MDFSSLKSRKRRNAASVVEIKQIRKDLYHHSPFPINQPNSPLSAGPTSQQQAIKQESGE